MGESSASFTAEGTAQRWKGTSQGCRARWIRARTGTQESQRHSHLTAGTWGSEVVQQCPRRHRNQRHS